MNIPRYPIVDNPQFSDRIFNQIQKMLIYDVRWLDHAFGKAQRLVKLHKSSNKKIYYPGIYYNDEQYINLSPSEDLGNFTFFLLHEPERIQWTNYQYADVSCDFSLILWFDFRKIGSPDDSRNLETIKNTFLNSLNRPFLTNGFIKINRIWEQAQNIYKGFDIDEIDNQYLMQPYAGLRFEGELKIEQECIPRGLGDFSNDFSFDFK